MVSVWIGFLVALSIVVAGGPDGPPRPPEKKPPKAEKSKVPGTVHTTPEGSSSWGPLR